MNRMNGLQNDNPSSLQRSSLTLATHWVASPVFIPIIKPADRPQTLRAVAAKEDGRRARIWTMMDSGDRYCLEIALPD